MKIGVPVGTYQKPTAAVQEVVNYYAEKSEQRARGEVILLNTPGLTRTATLTNGRALHEFGRRDEIVVATEGGAVGVADCGTAFRSRCADMRSWDVLGSG